MSYRVYFTNFQYYAQEEFKSVHDALRYGKSKAFDFSVQGPSGHVVSWSMFGGEKWYRRGEFDKEFSQYD